VGGPHIFNVCTDFDLATQDLVLDTMGADIYIFDSQGEGTLAHLVEQLRANGSGDIARVPNLVYRDRGGLLRTPRLPERNPSEEMGVDWRQFDPSFFTPTAYMRTARSCPFTCAFCNYPAMAGKHEMMSVQAVEQELRMLHEAGCKNVIFIDDTFNVPLPRFKEICRMMIRNKFNFKWVSFFRCSNSDDEAFDLMAESGCIGVLLGIESGDQQVLDIMNKAVKIEKYFNGVRKLKERGVIAYTLFFFGHPGETPETAQHTIDFVRETAPDFYLAQLYFHDAKVPIHRRAEEFVIQGGGYNWKHKTMDWREASQWVEHMYQTIDNSTILPLYGIGLWTLPYLVGKGITQDQFKRFTRVANDMLVKSLPDVPVDFSAEEAQLRAIFQPGVH
jgi:p-methyltransferase